VSASDSLFARLIIVDHYEGPAVEKSRHFSGDSRYVSSLSSFKAR
jgi:hypothetical protein